MPNMVELIKKAAMEAVNESKPTAIIFGDVIGVNPLKVQIDQKLILSSAQLILTKGVTDHEVEMTVDQVKKKYLIHNALTVGDQVILIQVQGGQKFLAIEKVVKA